MKTSLQKSVMVAGIALLAGFLLGSFFKRQETSPKLTAQPSGRELPGETGEVHHQSMSLSSPDVRPQATDVLTNEVVHEIELPPELLNRLTNGEYVLQYEFPTARLGLSNHVALNLKDYRPVIDREYDGLFKEIGLNENAAVKMKNHLAAIQHARVEAEAYLVELGDAKIAYDEQMKRLLGPDQYRTYREAESARPATRELSTIKDYLDKQAGYYLTAPDEDSLLEALKRSKQNPEMDGPYGQGTRVAVGEEKVLAGLVEDLNQLHGEHNALKKNLSESGASELLLGRINDYYTERERNKQEEIKSVMLSASSFAEELTRQPPSP